MTPRETPRDWVDWHCRYDDPDSTLSRRLAVVRRCIGEALDAAPPGPIRVVSMCAGDGRDLLGVLPSHPRGHDVHARLVEIDPRLADGARRAAVGFRVDVVVADAATTDSYAGAVPAYLVLACGVFGNIADADVATTVAALPQFTRHSGIVVWTRHRGEPDLVPSINRWFASQGFDPVWLSDAGAGYGVGVHRFTGTPQPLRTGLRLFTFVTDR